MLLPLLLALLLGSTYTCAHPCSLSPVVHNCRFVCPMPVLPSAFCINMIKAAGDSHKLLLFKSLFTHLPYISKNTCTRIYITLFQQSSTGWGNNFVSGTQPSKFIMKLPTLHVTMDQVFDVLEVFQLQESHHLLVIRIKWVC